MIPKVIHYAWFGSTIPKQIQKRIDNWQEMLPDWEFKYWNETNFSFEKFPFSKKMLDEGKLGYVSDELRYSVLFNYGGFYLDTDMIIKRDLSPFLKNKMTWGFLYDNSLATGIIGSAAKEPLLEKILQTYQGNINPEIHNQLESMTSNPVITKIMMKEYKNFCVDGSRQSLGNGIEIYPRDYFTYLSKNKNANYAEHLFDNSWGNKNNGSYGAVKQEFKKLFPLMWAKISARRGIKSAEKTVLFFKKRSSWN